MYFQAAPTLTMQSDLRRESFSTLLPDDVSSNSCISICIAWQTEIFQLIYVRIAHSNECISIYEVYANDFACFGRALVKSAGVHFNIHRHITHISAWTVYSMSCITSQYGQYQHIHNAHVCLNGLCVHPRTSWLHVINLIPSVQENVNICFRVRPSYKALWTMRVLIISICIVWQTQSLNVRSGRRGRRAVSIGEVPATFKQGPEHEVCHCCVLSIDGCDI